MAFAYRVSTLSNILDVAQINDGIGMISDIFFLLSFSLFFSSFSLSLIMYNISQALRPEYWITNISCYIKTAALSEVFPPLRQFLLLFCIFLWVQLFPSPALLSLLFLPWEGLWLNTGFCSAWVSARMEGARVFSLCLFWTHQYHKDIMNLKQLKNELQTEVCSASNRFFFPFPVLSLFYNHSLPCYRRSFPTSSLMRPETTLRSRNRNVKLDSDFEDLEQKVSLHNIHTASHHLSLSFSPRSII